LTLSNADPIEETLMLREAGEPALSVHHVPGPGPSVLYVHGATFPAKLSIGYRIAGKSWADDLHSRGFDVWSFDFAGYGGSEREGRTHAEVPGRAGDAALQIERVVRYVRKRTGHPRIAIIAHSWGTIPAGMFAGEHPKWVSSLILFGPVARRNQEGETAPVGPYQLVGESDQWQSFQSGVPDGEGSPIDANEFRTWIEAYFESDSTSRKRTPPSVEVPAGPVADFSEAWDGYFPYDPSSIRVPTLIVRGEWDAITRDADAEWLKKAMANVPGGARDVKLPRGAHRMHLEKNRQALFDAVGDFLTEQGQ
jgi:pimeloyl-ACP methyl ester carboxylesterase